MSKKQKVKKSKLIALQEKAFPLDIYKWIEFNFNEDKTTTHDLIKATKALKKSDKLLKECVLSALLHEFEKEFSFSELKDGIFSMISKNDIDNGYASTVISHYEAKKLFGSLKKLNKELFKYLAKCLMEINNG